MVAGALIINRRVGVSTFVCNCTVARAWVHPRAHTAGGDGAQVKATDAWQHNVEQKQRRLHRLNVHHNWCSGEKCRNRITSFRQVVFDRLGLALFDLEKPEKCLLRGDSWIFGPAADYERNGDVNDVVFPCGYTIDPDGDTVNLHYGANDCSIALARTSVRSLLVWLGANGSCERRQRGED